MSALVEIAKLSTTATAKKHDDKPLLVNKDGVLPDGGLLHNVFDHAASVTLGTNANHAKCKFHELDGGGVRTITFPADMSAFVGREYVFYATGTARAHVITGTAGQFGGDDSITFPGASSNESLRVFVVSPTLMVCTGAGHSTTANDYVIA